MSRRGFLGAPADFRLLTVLRPGAATTSFIDRIATRGGHGGPPLQIWAIDLGEGLCYKAQVIFEIN